MFNKRTRIGNYFYIWHNAEGKVLQITQMQNKTPQKQIGFEVFDNTARITYYGFGNNIVLSPKNMLINKDCLLYNEIITLIKSLDKNHIHNPTLIDSHDKKSFLNFDCLDNNIKVHFKFSSPYTSTFYIDDKKEIIENFVDTAHKKLTKKVMEENLEL